VGWLYPDIMATYGDRGNLETVLRRCQWRGITAEVTELRLGDVVRPAALDLILIGGGGEAQQQLVAADLYKVKGAGIREAVAQGAAALAVGGGYELFGRFCQPGQGAELRGAGVFDTWTIRPAAVLAGHYATIAAARADRVIGELVARWGGRLLVGFENHAGGTYLGPAARPLGQVIAGYGNNGDGTEGVIAGAAIGTNLRGPCLPKNPALADYLIAAALTRRYGTADLQPLADELELAARQAALYRARYPAGTGTVARTAALTRAVLRRPAGRRPVRTRSGQPQRRRVRPATGPARATSPAVSAARDAATTDTAASQPHVQLSRLTDSRAAGPDSTAGARR
jgi:lipid II isoglutaminyl synthase (glutamine-hydrolysing)